jgi:soluble lytic murein transglycosylase-like protein
VALERPSSRTPSLLRRSATQYDDLIEHHAATQGIRPELVRAVIDTESRFNPWARSSKGALGLMQLMPGTALDLGVANAFDPDENIRGGVTYLRQMLNRYDGNEELALAAYNAGPAAVDRHGARIPPYRETRAYVTRVRSIAGVGVFGATSRPAIYRVLERDGRTVLRYSNVRPTSGLFEPVGKLN